MSRRRTYNKRGASGNSGQYIIIGTYGEYLKLSSDYGNTWVDLVGAGKKDWKCACISSNGKVICACPFSGFIQLSKDGGNTWAEIGVTKSGWNALGMSDDGKFITAGLNRDSLFCSDNFGETFTEQGCYYVNKIAVSKSGQYQIFSESSGLYQSSDYGATFAKVATFGSSNISGLDMSADGKIRIVATSGSRLSISLDHGSTYSEITTRNAASWTSVAISSDGNNITASYSNYISTSKDAGATWNEVNISAYLNKLEISTGGNIQIGAETSAYPKMLISRDHWESWQSVFVIPLKYDAVIAINK